MLTLHRVRIKQNGVTMSMCILLIRLLIYIVIYVNVHKYFYNLPSYHQIFHTVQNMIEYDRIYLNMTVYVPVNVNNTIC